MNIYSQVSKRQSGIALIIFLTIIVLGTATFLVSEANNSRFQREIDSQKQTAKVLRQAKDALLGFAAVYAETHSNEPQGYLPCPDLDGDGSSESYCGDKGESILGRFPWRTLGLPALRDGNGDCLWYAVSGNYKDKPKSALTSDTPGLFIVENVNGDKIAGAACTSSSCVSEDDAAKQTIAIIFSPGKVLDGQSRVSTGTKTICGSENTLAPITDIDNLNSINKAENYLDKFTVTQGTDYIIDNSKGTNNSATTDNWGKEKLPTEINSVFIKAPLTYDTNSEIIFNDTLMLITQKDFEHIYERMDFWVAKQVSKCLEKSAGTAYQDYFLNDVFKDTIGGLEIINDPENSKIPDVGTYRKVYKTEIENFINYKITSCNNDCDGSAEEEVDACKTDCGSDSNKDDYRARAIHVEERYPWAAKIDDLTCFNNVGYNDDSYESYCQPDNGEHIGRIPNIPNDANNGMLTHWTTSPNCFKTFWWNEWKERVFYAINDEYTPNVTTHFWVRLSETTTIATIDNDDKWKSVVSIPTLPSSYNLKLNGNDAKKFVVLVSGRRLDNQTRVDDTAKINVDNYLEGENNTINDNIFERKKTGINFNDVVCKDKELDCIIPN